MKFDDVTISLTFLAIHALPWPSVFCELHNLTFAELPPIRGIPNDTQYLLVEIFNWYRRQTALGKLYDKPMAANMKKLYLDKKMAAETQAWADTCGLDNTNEKSKYGMISSQFGNDKNIRDTTGIIKTAFTFQWVDYITPKWDWKVLPDGTVQGDGTDWEERNLDYAQIVWADEDRVGCGWNSCKDSPWVIDARLVCSFNVKRKKKHAPYIVGKPCSRCPPGFLAGCEDGVFCKKGPAPLPTTSVPAKDVPNRKPGPDSSDRHDGTDSHDRHDGSDSHDRHDGSDRHDGPDRPQPPKIPDINTDDNSDDNSDENSDTGPQIKARTLDESEMAFYYGDFFRDGFVSVIPNPLLHAIVIVSLILKHSLETMFI